jgi:hypothetical protein
MKYQSLTQQQKEWIKEIQRTYTPLTMGVSRRHYSTLKCDAETGNIFELDEFELNYNLIGNIPRKAIPNRNLILEMQRSEKRQSETSLSNRTRELEKEKQERDSFPVPLIAQGEADYLFLLHVAKEMNETKRSSI